MAMTTGAGNTMANDEKELITLDFVEHDSVAALRYLIGLFENNKASGMVFAVSLKHKRRHPRIIGVTGALAVNTIEAAGIAGVLHLEMVKHAAEHY